MEMVITKWILNGVEIDMTVDETEAFIENVELFDPDPADKEIVNFRIHLSSLDSYEDDNIKEFAISIENFYEMFDNWIDSEEATQKKIDSFLTLLEDEYARDITQVVALTPNGSEWDITDLFTALQ